MQTDLLFTALNSTLWNVEVYTSIFMDSLALETGERDVYRFSLANTISALNTPEPIQLFSLSLPDGCNGGAIEILSNADSFSSSLLADNGISIDNFFSAVVSPALDAVDLYHGNDDLAGSLACENQALDVTLAYFHAKVEAGKSVFVWQTATETGNAGFNLVAEQEGALLQINTDLIPSKWIDSLESTTYRFVAETPMTTFFLDEIHIDGRRVRHGPFILGQAYGLLVEDGADFVKPDLYLPMILR